VARGQWQERADTLRIRLVVPAELAPQVTFLEAHPEEDVCRGSGGEDKMPATM